MSKNGRDLPRLLACSLSQRGSATFPSLCWFDFVLALVWPIWDMANFANFGFVHISTVWTISHLVNFKFEARGQAVTAEFEPVCPFGSEGGTEHHGADPTIGPVMGKARDFGTCTLSDTRLHVEEKVLHVKRPLSVSEGHSESTAHRPHRHRVSAAPSESNNSPSSACTVEPLIAAWLKFSLYG